MLELENGTAGEEGLEPAAPDAVNVVGPGAEGGVPDAKGVVEGARLGILSADRVYDLVVVGVAEVDLVRCDAYYRACEERGTRYELLSSNLGSGDCGRGLSSRPYISCNFAICL